MEFRTKEYIKAGYRLFIDKPQTLILYCILSAAVYFGLALLPGVGPILQFVAIAFFQAGMYLLVEQQQQEGKADLNRLHRLSDLAAPIIIAHLVASALIAVGYIFLLLPGIYLSVAYQFTTPYVVLEKQGFWEAMEKSRKLLTTHWWAFSGFLFLLLLVNILGFLCLGVGLFASVPITSCAIYFAFKDLQQEVAAPTVTSAS